MRSEARSLRFAWTLASRGTATVLRPLALPLYMRASLLSMPWSAWRASSARSNQPLMSPSWPASGGGHCDADTLAALLDVASSSRSGPSSNFLGALWVWIVGCCQHPRSTSVTAAWGPFGVSSWTSMDQTKSSSAVETTKKSYSLSLHVAEPGATTAPPSSSGQPEAAISLASTFQSPPMMKASSSSEHHSWRSARSWRLAPLSPTPSSR